MGAKPGKLAPAAAAPVDERLLRPVGARGRPPRPAPPHRNATPGSPPPLVARGPLARVGRRRSWSSGLRGRALRRRPRPLPPRARGAAGLYDTRNLNMRKLRRDILKGRLAPCFQGLEQGGPASEECPICMLQYPALNRSRCCGQGICTECYAQVGEKYRAAAPEKLGGCPFCKTPGYRASYEGCLSAQEVAEREAESREVAEAQERQRLGELERQAEREREVAEMRRNSTEEVPAQEAPGRLPEGAGHSGRAVPVGSRAGAGGGAARGAAGRSRRRPSRDPAS